MEVLGCQESERGGEAANLTVKMAQDVACEASEMLHAERV